MKGLFISFEGVEGSGKSTQINLLYNRLKKENKKVIITKEPGGSVIGQEIRNILLNPEFNKMAAKTEILLYTADRAQHVAEKIRPALKDNKIVLTDRYLDSNIAYQGYGRGIDLEMIKQINKWVIKDCLPDLTFIIDMDVKKGLKRARKISGSKQGDRIEQEELIFHEKVRQAFRNMAKKENYILLNGDKSIEELAAEIYKHFCQFFTREVFD